MFTEETANLLARMEETSAICCAKTIDRECYKYTAVIRLRDLRVIYMTPGMAERFDVVHCPHILGDLVDHILSRQDHELFLCALEAARRDVFPHLSTTELASCVFNGDFKAIICGKPYMIHATVSAHVFNENRSPGYVVCTFPFPSHDSTGRFHIAVRERSGYYQFNAHTMRWDVLRIPALTDEEQHILIYTAIGTTETEMGGNLNISAQTIKHKKSFICKKLGTNNMREALCFAINHNLLLGKGAGELLGEFEGATGEYHQSPS